MRARSAMTIVIGAALLGLQPSDAANSSQPCASSIGICPIQGCSSHPTAAAPFDPLLNVEKNRDVSQIPAAGAGTLDVNRFLDRQVLPLHVPAANNPKDLRAGWEHEDVVAQKIRELEANKVALIGYILRAKSGGVESCNCDLSGAGIVDIHLNIVETASMESSPTDLLGDSVIVEVTHRIRDESWSPTAFNAISLSSQRAALTPRVRIIGALTYDNLHWDMLRAGTRGTLWEIHPITEVDVEVNRRWVPFNARTATAIMSLAAGRSDNASQSLAFKASALTAGGHAFASKPAAADVLEFTNARTIHWSPDAIERLDERIDEKS